LHQLSTFSGEGEGQNRTRLLLLRENLGRASRKGVVVGMRGGWLVTGIWQGGYVICMYMDGDMEIDMETDVDRAEGQGHGTVTHCRQRISLSLRSISVEYRENIN
jgi:hypothetical protein